MRVGPAKPEHHLQERGVGDARGVADERPLVGRAHGELAADDHVGFAGLEDVDRALVEVGVAQVDLVAQDEVAPREQDALLEGLAVVRLAQGDDLDLPVGGVRVLGGELVADLDGAVLRAVLGQDDLVAPPERLEAFAQIDNGGVEDRLLVVDGMTMEICGSADVLLKRIVH